MVSAKGARARAQVSSTHGMRACEGARCVKERCAVKERCV